MIGGQLRRALAVAALSLAAMVAPVAAHELPGADCFTATDPAAWQLEVSAMGPGQLETLDACLNAAGWSRQADDDDATTGRQAPAARPGWPCAYDPATVDALTSRERAELRACLDAFGWDHTDDDDATPGTGDGTGAH